ncbi:MAG TPA: TonB-dependent receptor, partial [Usitatibacter sp.]|nr:TonB-dependent receptor [Usitatibacter sp.]
REEGQHMTRKSNTLSHAVRAALGASVALGLALPVAAQQAQKVEKIEVTGSNIKRIEGETALPVQIITREEIEKTGATTTEQFLLTLSVAMSNNANTAATNSGSATAGISSVSLRGLGSNRTLVLVNGRRMPAYGTITDSVSVDVNTIPLAAVDRVEILKDGASAIYGSDAIAGVINFILRKDYRGAEANVRYSKPEHPNGQVTRVDASAGFGDLSTDRFNVLVVGSYQKDKALYGRDRDFARSGINAGALNDTSSGNTFPANIVLPDGTQLNPAAPNCAPSVASPLFPPTRCRFDPSPLVSLAPEAKRGNLYAAGRFALTPSWELFAEASYAKTEQTTVIQPVPLSDQFALPPSHPLFNVAPYNGFSTIVLSASSPYYPRAFIQAATGGATPDVLVRYRSVVTGNRSITDIVEQPRLVAGISGTAASWDVEAGYLHVESKLTERVNSGYPSQTAILPLLNSGQVNFFGDNTPQVQALIDATQFHGDAYNVKNSVDSLAAKASRDLLRMGAGSLAIAVGAELRTEKFDVDPSLTIQSGDISGYGGNFLPVHRSRDVKSVFSELNVPVGRALEANFAVRWDDYEGTGSKTTPKASIKFQPTRQLLLRAAIGKGFRAPSLNDLYQPNLSGVSAPGLNDTLRCPTTGSSNDCQTQFPVLTGGNAGLKPEESTNTNVGFLFEPSNMFSFGVDAFRINVKNTILNGIVANTILADLDQFGYLVTRGPVQSAFPNLPGPIVQIDQTNLNLGETRVQGYDIDAKLRLPVVGGRLTVAFNGTYFQKYQIQNIDGTFTETVGTIVGTTGFGGVTPRWRHYVAADWSRGPWSFTLSQSFQLGYKDLAGTFEDPSEAGFKLRRVGSYEIYDVQAGYRGIRNVKLAAGIRNLLDRAPPYTNAGGQNYFQGGYDPTYVDPRGRTFYVALGYTFR